MDSEMFTLRGRVSPSSILSSQLLCVLCARPLIEPRQASCGDRICSRCYSSLLASSAKEKLVCKQCNLEVTIKQESLEGEDTDRTDSYACHPVQITAGQQKHDPSSIMQQWPSEHEQVQPSFYSGDGQILSSKVSKETLDDCRQADFGYPRRDCLVMSDLTVVSEQKVPPKSMFVVGVINPSQYQEQQSEISETCFAQELLMEENIEIEPLCQSGT